MTVFDMQKLPCRTLETTTAERYTPPLHDALPIEAQEKHYIGGFEDNINPVVRPTLSLDNYNRYLWGHDPDNNAGDLRPGHVEISNEQAFDGTRSLKAIVDSAMNSMVQYHSYSDDGYEWKYMREHQAWLYPERSWTMNKYNRMKFWVKLDPGTIKQRIRQHNIQFGTYIRATDGVRSNSESGGGHYYHYYNIGYTGEWHQVIVDTHPQHERGSNGAVEHGNLEYPTNEPGYNYFDLLTWFYFTVETDLTSYPGANYLDGFELYYDPNPENVDQIYGLNGVYIPRTNTVTVGWSRNKDEDNINHEVRYSFTDVHDIGWDNAIVAPGTNVIAPSGMGGYNGMEYSTDGIDISEKAYVYIAIKPQGSNLFRQIKIPVLSDFNIPQAPSDPLVN